MKTKVVRLGGGLLAVHIFLLITAAQAAPTNKWAALGPGKWETSANWDTGVPNNSYSLHRLVPVAAINAFAIIDAATVTNSVSTGCLTISNLTVQGGALFSTSTLVLSNGNTAPGNIALVINNNLNINTRGSVTMTNARLHLMAGGTNGLHINGSMFLNSGELAMTNCTASIGDTGSGQITVRGGTWGAKNVEVGTVGQGTVTLAGGVLNASHLDAGNDDDPALTTASGTVLLDEGQATIGGIVVGGIAGSGKLTISNATLNCGSLVVGGALAVAGGTTICNTFTVGEKESTNTATVLLTGGELDSAFCKIGVLAAGSRGYGQMTISNGIWRADQVVLTPFLSLTNPVGSGTLTIAGGTCVISSNLTVGNSACLGEAALEITGGSLFVTNAAHNAVLDVRSGTFSVSSGTLVVDKLVMTNSCGRFIHGGGILVISSPNLAPNLDADGDGLPNYWEQQYGFDLFSPLTAAEDTDNDGLDNTAEYSLGTNPRNASDPFHVTGIALEGSNVRVSWVYAPPPGNSFTHCVLQGSPTLTGGWVNAANPIAMPSESFNIQNTNQVEIGAATNFPSRFYRVVMLP